MRSFRTLRGRLTAFAMLAAVVAMTVVVVLFNVLLHSSLRGYVNSRLRTQAAAAATTVVGPGGHLSVRESPDDEAIDSQVWVFDGTRVVLRPPGPRSLQLAAEALAGQSHAFADVKNPDTRLYAQPVTRGGRPVGTIVAGQSLFAYDRTTDVALIGTFLLGGALLAAVLAVTWLTIGRALTPVTDMTRSVADWSEHDVARRFGTAPRPDELGELAHTFDDLLDRLAASLRHEQRLSAELSHELRTPLARITAEIEMLRRRERSPEDRQEAYEVVERSAAQMSGILETLMAAARAEAQTAGGRGHLDQAFAALEDAWAGPLAERHVTLELEPTEEVVGVDADVVERIVAPLLDNAGRYAQSHVVVQAGREGGRVRVRVRDDGPGIDPGEREAVFEPGVRGARANGHGGAGLGLSLSRRLARAAGGDVTVAEAPAPERPGGHGTTFVVDLPA
jgi:two-component system heavy metal sensor histidine kinase CusS